MIKKIFYLLSCCLVSCATAENDSDEKSQTNTQKIIGGRAEVAFKNIVMSLSESGELCTGSLIAPNLVLTAAHCVFNRSKLDQNPDDFAKHIYIGNNANGMKIPVEKSIAHPGYKKPRGEADDQNDDIALLVLRSEVQGIEPLAITDSKASNFIGEDLLAVGFGLNDEINQRGAGTKRSVTLKITQEIESRFIAERKTQQAQDTCSGDSGGPGLVNIDGTWVILGTVKRGGPEGCIGLTYYVQVAAHLDWINEIVRSLQLTPPKIINGDFDRNESEWAKFRDPSNEDLNGNDPSAGGDRGTWTDPQPDEQSNEAGYNYSSSENHDQNHANDGCALNGYYGDGRCDRFCDQPDPDCENSTLDECLNNGFYGDGTCDDFCNQPDPDCETSSEDFCEINGYYGDGYCDENCPVDDPDCEMTNRSDQSQEEDICELYGFYGDGECDDICLYEDPDCAQ